MYLIVDVLNKVLRIDNGDLRAMRPRWCVFADNLVIYYLIWT